MNPQLNVINKFYNQLQGIKYNDIQLQVYDYVPQTATYPYILLGDQTMTTGVAIREKKYYHYDISQIIEIVFGYEGDCGGKQEVLIVSNTVTNLILNKQIKFDNWNTLSADLAASFTLTEYTDTHLIQRQILRFEYQLAPDV